MTAADRHEIEELVELDRALRWDELIDGLRQRLEADRRALSDPRVKDWCGRRWRNLFIANAAADPDAVAAAGKRIGLPGTDLSVPSPQGDDRPDRQRVAERFLLGAGEEWREEMPEPQVGGIDRSTLVFCPGLISTMLPRRGFELVFPELAERHGWSFLSAETHPMRGCEANVADLCAALERGEGLDPDLEPVRDDRASPPERAFLLGYSKGTPDALSLFVHRPELTERIGALFCWGGAAGGSHLADDIYAQVEGIEWPKSGLGDALKAMLKTVFPIVRMDGVTERLEEFDVKGAINDLKTDVRARFMSEHGEEIDRLDVPIFNVTAATRATEVPFFQVQGYMEIARRDPDNDMQLTQEQARVQLPMATDLAVLRAHHWDISYDPFPVHTRLGSPNLDHRFPRAAAIAANFQFAAELGLIH